MKFLVIFLFAIVAIVTAVEPNQGLESEVRECEPGKAYMEYCNRCVCSSDGRSSVCTRKLCDRKVWNRDGSKKEFPDEVLVDDEKKNSTEDEPERHNVEKRQVCVPGTIFRNYCNTCECNNEGTASTCTQKRCGNGEFERNGQRPYVHYDIQWLKKGSEINELSLPVFNERCEPGKSFKFYCNTCQCDEDGVPSTCTLAYCAPGLYNRDGSITIEQQEVELKWENDELEAMRCEPHTSFSYYCNHCFCSESGKVSFCTDMMCPPGMYNRDGSKVIEIREVELKREHGDLTTLHCEPNTNFNYYCNQCRCSESGTVSYCSNMKCPPGLYNRNGSRVLKVDQSFDYPRAKREVENYFPTIICEPNKNFMHYCNRCRCGDTGIGATCTFAACIPGVYNRNGSLKVNPNEDDDVPSPNQPRNVTFGTWADGVKEGDEEEEEEEEEEDFSIMRCEPNKKFMHYCNRCRCSKSGIGASCTFVTCPPGAYNRDGSLKIHSNENVVVDRTKRQVDDDSSVVSSDKLLGFSEFLDQPFSCQPNEYFARYCHFCQCAPDGESVECIRLGCPPLPKNLPYLSFPPIFRSRRSPGPVRACEPNSFFKKSCNQCKCDEDGISFECTIKVCTQ